MNTSQVVDDPSNLTVTEVTQIIKSYVGTVPGTLTSVNSGNGIKCDPEIIKTTGEISLDANLSDIKDVNSNIDPSINQVLAWTGENWNAVDSNSSGLNSVSFESITNTPDTIVSNKLLSTTSDSIEFIDNDYINSIDNGVGITSVKNDNTVLLGLDFNNIPEQDSIGEKEKIVIVDSNDKIKLVKKNKVTIDNFKEAENYIKVVSRNSLTGTYPITVDSGNGIIGFDGSVMTGTDFDNFSITGILPLENGGTQSSTAEGARANLGLAYNEDILSYNNPKYKGDLKGPRLRLLPVTGTITIVSTGEAYKRNAKTYFKYNGNFIEVNIVLQGDNDTGLISSVELKEDVFDMFTESITNTELIQYVGEVEVNVTDPCIINFTVSDSYINFGSKYNEEGIGFRNKDNTIEYRYSEDVDWETMKDFSNSLTGLEDVDATSEENSLLIYKDGKYKSIVPSGNIIIEDDGFTLTGKISPEIIKAIKPGTSNDIIINSDEFGTLHGIDTGETIKSQLAEKLDTPSNGPTNNAILYYNDNEWRSLNPDPQDDGKFLKYDTSSGIVWKNNTLAGLEDVETNLEENSLLIYKDGKYTSIVPSGNIIIEDDGFILTGEISPANIKALEPGTSNDIIINSREFGTLHGIDTSETIKSQLAEKITNPITNSNYSLLYYIDGTWKSLNPVSEDGGKFLKFNSLTEGLEWSNSTETLIPSSDSTFDLGSSDYKWNSIYLNKVNLKTHTVDSAPECLTGQDGGLAYFSNGYLGEPCLAVCVDQKWKVVTLGDEISSQQNDDGTVTFTDDDSIVY